MCLPTRRRASHGRRLGGCYHANEFAETQHAVCCSVWGEGRESRGRPADAHRSPLLHSRSGLARCQTCLNLVFTVPKPCHCVFAGSRLHLPPRLNLPWRSLLCLAGSPFRRFYAFVFCISISKPTPKLGTTAAPHASRPSTTESDSDSLFPTLSECIRTESDVFYLQLVIHCDATFCAAAPPAPTPAALLCICNRICPAPPRACHRSQKM